MSTAWAQSVACGLGSWWNRPTPGGGWLRDAAYGAGRFVAVGDEGAMLTSIDGARWQTRWQVRSISLSRVEYCQGQFFAMGRQYGPIFDTWGAVLWTSPDGLEWQPRYTGTNTVVYGVAFGGGQFVALGNAIVNGLVTHVTRPLTSYDGEQWTEQAPMANGWLYDLTFGNGVFIAVGGGRILRSSDGVTWQPAAGELPPNQTLQAVGFFRNQFIAVGGGGSILTSPDGNTWTAQTSGTTSFLAAITSGDGVVAVSGNDGLVLTSKDGIDWTPRLGFTSHMRGLAYGADSFVTVGRYGTIYQSGRLSECNPTRLTMRAGPQTQIEVIGTVGASYRVEYTEQLGTAWHLVQNVPALPASPYAIYDPTRPAYRQRWYRVSGPDRASLVVRGYVTQLELTGLVDTLYRVEFTDDLNQPWQPLWEILPLTTSPFAIVDPVPPSHTQRFYRAVSLPALP